MKFFTIILITTILFGLTPKTIHAITQPLAQPNNQFGIHIIDQNDFQKAAELVNSSGGEWGYITVVIREDDRDIDKWQQIFDKARRLKLIPLVRLATKLENQSWAKPRIEDVEPWADFLNSLNWVTKNRYIILFNEPNHAKEWGGQIDPQEYAKLSRLFHTHLKAASDDFFILPAGLDLAADNTRDTMHPKDFLEKMYQSDDQIFRIFDGWTSHSYPNPNFSGNTYDTGRNSIIGYRWEQNLLKSLNLDKKLPLFITETGWSHAEGMNYQTSHKPADQVAQNFKVAFEQIWTDDNVVAITPFLLNYQDEPFDHFSWLKPATNQPYPQFDTVKQLAKVAGQPEQIEDSQLVKRYFPKQILAETNISIATQFINTGQTIWNSQEYSLYVETSLEGSSYTLDSIPTTEPGDIAKAWLNLTTPEQTGQHNITLQLQKRGQPFGEPVTYTFTVVKQTNLVARIKIWLDQLLHHKNLLVLLYQDLQTTT